MHHAGPDDHTRETAYLKLEQLEIHWPIPSAAAADRRSLHL